MDQPSKQLRDISEKSASLVKIIQNIKNNSELYDNTCHKWGQICLNMPDQVKKGIIRIAVTGAVKSGKSTFINSIFKTDFLKRGAGVVTSVVTKIQRQDSLNAKLLIKSWDEINFEIEEALYPFDNDCSFETEHFDLRRKKDRTCLRQIYEKLSVKTSFANNQLKPEVILFNNVLKNYEFCKDFIKPDKFMLELKNNKFEGHKVFTGDPSKAFFIKDAKLEIDFGNIANDIEIADCQGIDSTDTAQLSEVLEYLESSNMIIYLISSRTGLREADIRLLSIIIKMGIADNVVFIVNCDLNEHESLKDLIAVEKKVQQDLLYFKQNVHFYSFSSLYNLFNQNRLELSLKNEQQIKAWEIDQEIIEYSDDMSERFFSYFEDQTSKKRNNLIFSNPLQRLNIIAKGLQKKIHFFSDIFLNDEVTLDTAIKEINEIQTGIAKIQMLVKNSRQAIHRDLKNEIDTQIDNYFLYNKNSIINNLFLYIENYVVGFDKFEEQILTKEFPKALYLIFQDFKKEFDCFLVEKINPELIKFVKDQEKALENQAASLFSSYNVDLFNLYKKLGNVDCDNLTLPDLWFVKEKLGIKPPPTIFTTQYSARIKISSFTGFGLSSLLLVLMKTLKKEPKFVAASVFKKASQRFKKEILRSIKSQINDYKQKIREEYFYLLIKALSEEINEIIIDQFQIYSVEIDNIESKFRQEKSEKDKQKKFLRSIYNEIEEIL
ncbi:MAG: dynamin family protein [Desulfobacteraceae bacterium]|nr:dynamin family protein [Desulfobacteraceae bacterium]